MCKLTAFVGWSLAWSQFPKTCHLSCSINQDEVILKYIIDMGSNLDRVPPRGQIKSISVKFGKDYKIESGSILIWQLSDKIRTQRTLY